MDKDYLNELLDECDYPRNEQLRKSVIAQLQNLTEESSKLFAQWKKNRKIAPNAFEIEGITPVYLKTVRKMEDIAIILAYDGLIREPKKSAVLLREPVIKRSSGLHEVAEKGILTFSGGRVYEGEYRKGLPSGEGRMKYGNGAVYYGQWKDGRREGIGQYYQPSGTILSGMWHNGQLTSGVSIDVD